MTTGVPLAALVADDAFARRIAAPLLVVHDMNDAEVPIANGRVYAQAPNARMLATDGLGHRRIGLLNPQSQTGNSQINDPYWQPCDYTKSSCGE